MAEEDTLCVGICLPDEDESYCIGCGRTWGTSNVPAHVPNSPPLAVPPVPTFPASLSRADTEESPDRSDKE